MSSVVQEIEYRSFSVLSSVNIIEVADARTQRCSMVYVGVSDMHQVLLIPSSHPCFSLITNEQYPRDFNEISNLNN